MDKVAKGLISQLMSSLSDLPDTCNVQKLTGTKFRVKIYEPSMMAESADDEDGIATPEEDAEPEESDSDGEKPETYIVELKVTKAK